MTGSSQLNQNHMITAIKRASGLLQQRQWHQAKQLLSQTLAGIKTHTVTSTDNHAELLRLQGIAQIQLNEPQQALQSFQKALELQPKRAVLYLNLGSCYQSLQQADQSEAAFCKAIELEPRLPAARFNLGRLKLSTAHPQEAADCFRQTLKLQPNHWQAAMCLGHALKATGELANSAAAYRKGLQLQPESGDLWWSLANIKTVEFQDHEVQLMQNQVKSPRSAQQAIGTHFALGMALESRQDFPGAFEQFRLGNQLKRRTVEYNAAAKQELGQRIITSFSKDLLARHPAAGNVSAAPIFIVSLPRSGSTLVEQILATHPQVNGASELPELGQLALAAMGDSDGIHWSPEKITELDDQQLTKLGDRYIQETRRWQQHTHFTDKMPNNFPLAGLIALILPNAKIINCRRHPVDTGLSCYRQLFARGHHWSYDLEDIASHYRYYDALSQHWKATLPGQFFEVEYEKLLADQRGITAKILNFCSLEWHEPCMQFFKSKRVVRTASAGQVRQKLNTTALNRWQHYQKFIAPLLALGLETRNNTEDM